MAQVTFVNDDGISKVTLNRARTKDPWGLRLSGGRDEGIALKLAKVQLVSPAGQVGLKAKDLLISVNNILVLDKGHEEVVNIIKTAQLELELTIERGHHLPSMALLAKETADGNKEKAIQNFYLNALREEPEYERSCKESVKVFTTAGPPKICTDQYNKPIGLYSSETVARMAETFEVDPSLNGENFNSDRHFSPDLSKVLNLILEEDEKHINGESRFSGLVNVAESTTNSRAASRADSTDGPDGSIIEVPRRTRNHSLNLPVHVADILLESEDKGRRGSRKMSLVLQGENNFLVDAKLAISEGRYGDLGFKTLL